MTGSGKQFLRNGMASICDWHLQVTFGTREQAHGFIRDYLSEGGDALSFNYDEDFVHDGTRYIIQIDASWAANLSHVAALLERWDHDMDGEAPKA